MSVILKVANWTFWNNFSNMKLRQIKDFLCKNRLQALCILNGVVLAVGLVVAMLLSDDTRWTNWSLSRLGETTSNRLSAFSFNSGVFLSGLIMATIGVFMNRGYLKLGQIRSARISGWILSLFAICMIGVALCPNDTMHAAHFVFSRGIVILMVLLMFILPSSLSYLTHRERISSFSFPIFAAIIAAQGYAMGKFWFVIVEVLLGIFATMWLVLVCCRMELKLSDLKTS